MVTKDEFRLRIVALEATVETLRSKADAARKDARTAAARILELEQQLAGQARSEEPPVPSRTSKPASTRATERAAPKPQAPAGDSGGAVAGDGGEP